ncbi:MAG: hypothetical protein GTO14_10095 [Anaerolineales bacterium]|nr:hypothetical protein [Anaerolineales bacterium]
MAIIMKRKKAIRTAAVFILVLSLLIPLGSIAFADEGTSSGDPVPEEQSDPPEQSENCVEEPSEDAPVECVEPDANPEQELAGEEPGDPSAGPESEQDGGASPQEVGEVESAPDAANGEELSDEVAPDQTAGGDEGSPQEPSAGGEDVQDVGEGEANLDSALDSDTKGDGEPVEEGEETVPDTETADTEKGEAVDVPSKVDETVGVLPEETDFIDPYFTVSNTVYSFGSIQAALNELSTVLNTTPDDNTIYVEPGSFAATDVDGTDWGAATPALLILQSESGSAVTTIAGSLTIRNMMDFVLRGFTVTGGITATGNNGSLTIEEVVADGSSGNGITVTGQDGAVVLDNVQANNNQNYGANITNVSTTEGVTISNSTFNNNNQTAGAGDQAGLAVTSPSEVVLENVEASGNLDGDGATIVADGVKVSNSTFNDNTSPTPGYGNGLAVESSGAPIVLNGVAASNNSGSGALLWFPAAAADPTNLISVYHSRFTDNGEFGVWAQPESGTVRFRCLRTSGNTWGGWMVPAGENVEWVKCLPSCDGKKHLFKDIVLKTDEPRYVNAGYGVMIKFPAIEVIDEGDKAFGRFRTLRKPKELPADLPLDDLFIVGAEILIFNAQIPEGEVITVEFFIPGYLWEETFAVLWWDVEASEWMEIPSTKEPHARIPGGKVVAEWPQPGIFVLVMRASPTSPGDTAGSSGS